MKDIFACHGAHLNFIKVEKIGKRLLKRFKMYFGSFNTGFKK